MVRIPGFHYCGLGSIPGQELRSHTPRSQKITLVVFFPFKYVCPFYPFSYLIMFWKEWWHWRFPLSCIFFPPQVLSHYVYFQSMPSILYTVFQKVTAELACVIWPSLINHHLGHLSKLYLSIKAQFKSPFLRLRLSISCPRLLLLKPTNSDNEGSVKTWNGIQGDSR